MKANCNAYEYLAHHLRRDAATSDDVVQYAAELQGIYDLFTASRRDPEGGALVLGELRGSSAERQVRARLWWPLVEELNGPAYRG